MPLFDFSGNLPQFKADLVSSQLRARFGDLKTYLNTLNPSGLVLPNITSAAEYQAFLLNAAKTGFTTNHVLRSNVPLNHDAGNGTSGQVLQSDGDGTTSWTTVTGLVTDGNKGDVTVSSGGAVITIDNNAITTAKIADTNVTYAKIQNISASNTLLGRRSSGAGSTEEISLSDHLQITNNKLTPSGIRTQAVYYSNNTLTGGDLNQITNTTSETSILNGLTIQNNDVTGGTWPTVAANTMIEGGTFKFKAMGTFATSGTPTVRIKVKMNTAVVYDTTAIATPTSGLAGVCEIDGIISFDVSAGLSNTSVMGSVILKVAPNGGGDMRGFGNASAAPLTGLNMSLDTTFDITWQWGTASAANQVLFTNVVIERVY